MFYNPWVTRQYVADSLDMGDIKSPMDVSLEVAKLEQQQGKVEIIAAEKPRSNKSSLPATKPISEFSPCRCIKRATPVHTTR